MQNHTCFARLRRAISKQFDLVAKHHRCRPRGLEGVDAVLEEGAANVEELKVIWGDPDEALDFDGFCPALSLKSAVSAW